MDNYRKTYRRQAGPTLAGFSDLARQYENRVATKDSPMPHGAMIAREFVEAGTDMAVLVELRGSRPTLVDNEAVCADRAA